MPDGKLPTTWNDDKLERKDYANFLTEYLAAQTEPFVINLNAEWGQGKTFFLTLWAQDVAEKHPTIRINAWETDYSDDPVVAFISAFEQQIKAQIPEGKRELDELKNFSQKAAHLFKVGVPAILKGFINKHIGEEGVAEIGQAIEAVSEEIINDYQQQEDAITQFKISLGALLEMAFGKKAPPMFVFVDEMDRCRPSYAVEMLENIKHFFNIPGLVFVVATDTSQLVHSVKALYGAGFDAHAYLRRFFDREYALPEPDYDQYSNVLMERFGLANQVYEIFFRPEYNKVEEVIPEYFALFAGYFGLSLRDQEQCFAKFEAICTASHGKHLFFPYLLFLIMLKLKEPQIFEPFLMGAKDVNDELNRKYGQNDKKTVHIHGDYGATTFVNEFFVLSCKDVDGLREDLEKSNERSIHYLLASEMLAVRTREGSYREKVLLVGGLT